MTSSPIKFKKVSSYGWYALLDGKCINQIYRRPDGFFWFFTPHGESKAWTLAEAKEEVKIYGSW